jgi:hypothetical protein
LISLGTLCPATSEGAASPLRARSAEVMGANFS